MEEVALSPRPSESPLCVTTPLLQPPQRPRQPPGETPRTPTVSPGLAEAQAATQRTAHRVRRSEGYLNAWVHTGYPPCNLTRKLDRLKQAVTCLDLLQFDPELLWGTMLEITLELETLVSVSRQAVLHYDPGAPDTGGPHLDAQLEALQSAFRRDARMLEDALDVMHETMTCTLLLNHSFTRNCELIDIKAMDPRLEAAPLMWRALYLGTRDLLRNHRRLQATIQRRLLDVQRHCARLQAARYHPLHLGTAGRLTDFMQPLKVTSPHKMQDVKLALDDCLQEAEHFACDVLREYNFISRGIRAIDDTWHRYVESHDRLF